MWLLPFPGVYIGQTVAMGVADLPAERRAVLKRLRRLDARVAEQLNRRRRVCLARAER
jgi:hypothetical protein